MSRIDRREAISLGALSLLSLALPGIGNLRADAAKKYRTLLWIVPDGGESQIDSWDPKPGAPAEIRGEFRAIDTAIKGIRVAEVYPRMAKLLGKVTLLSARRTDTELNHMPAMQAMLRRTGRSHLLAEHAQRTEGIPPIYAETPGVIAGFDYRREAYGTNNLVLEIGWDAGKKRFTPPQIGKPDARLPGRLGLLRKLDTLKVAQGERKDELWQKAVLLLGKAQAGIRLKDKDVERYGGENPIGVGILTMRELIRSGITGALVFRAGDWDDHDHLFDKMRLRAGQMDAGLSALVTDLKRGLLGDTLLVYAGEFGREPLINSDAGRDHFPFSSSILCGKNIKEGHVHGSTDSQGRGKDGIVSSKEFTDLLGEALATEPDFAKRSKMPRVFR